MSRSTLSRRTVLAAAGVAGAAAAWFGGLFSRGERPARTLSRDELGTLAAVQERLLPRDVRGPGARDVYATTYLERALKDPAVPANFTAHICKGIATLDAWARRHGAGDFLSLRPDGQDRAIRELSRTPRGGWWVRIVLGFTMEAFLGDPTRGGANPDEAGWRWAQHRPGWPRPKSPGWQPTERTS